jgi:hypothetical protein
MHQFLSVYLCFASRTCEKPDFSFFFCNILTVFFVSAFRLSARFGLRINCCSRSIWSGRRRCYCSYPLVEWRFSVSFLEFYWFLLFTTHPETKHTYADINECMDILQFHRKGKFLNILEQFHICIHAKLKIQLNDNYLLPHLRCFLELRIWATKIHDILIYRQPAVPLKHRH